MCCYYCRVDRTPSKQVLAPEDYYVNIRLHYNLFAVTAPHFAEVMQRLITVLPTETMAFMSIDVLQLANLHIRFRTFRHLSPSTPNEPEHRSD